MYSPSHFQEDRPEIIRDLIDQFPLATIVYQSDKVLCAEHVPLILDPSLNPAVRMLGHVARGNDLGRVSLVNQLLSDGSERGTEMAATLFRFCSAWSRGKSSLRKIIIQRD